MQTPQILITKPEPEYALLDSGDGEKLERYGTVIVSRPDPQALWPKLMTPTDWRHADAVFTRESKNAGWSIKKHIPERWKISFAGLQFWIKPTSFKHTGLFPEQSQNWSWVSDRIAAAGRPVSVLNLFGYTGGATLAASQAGAQVCHVDGSRTAVTWARENAGISGVGGNSIRWIVDDVRAFLKREIARGVRYDGIIMDPPAFGHGAKKEVWKIEDDLMPLFDLCKQVLSDDPIFFLVNGYASGYSAIAYENNLRAVMSENGGDIEIGELTIAETSGRLLPCGIFARWKK